MKKLIVLCLMVLLVGCNSGPTDNTCDGAKRQLELGGDVAVSDPMTVNFILNTNHAPDTVGATLKECIENGWDYR